jgi:hypothetical protein
VSADTLGKLLTLSLTLLGAYVAFISFTPKIIEEYRKVYERMQGTALDRARFKQRFKSTLNLVKGTAKFYPTFFYATGVSAGILLLNLAFSEVACNRTTCLFLWFPHVAGVILFLCLLYLLIVAYSFLQLFVKSVEELERDDGRDS